MRCWRRDRPTHRRCGLLKATTSGRPAVAIVIVLTGSSRTGLTWGAEVSHDARSCPPNTPSNFASIPLVLCSVISWGAVQQDSGKDRKFSGRSGWFKVKRFLCLMTARICSASLYA
jgi:predicted small integral membrane protein